MEWASGKQGSSTLRIIALSMALVLPQLALAQSASPFLTGATSLQTKSRIKRLIAVPPLSAKQDSRPTSGNSSISMTTCR